jgi:hypothetical protein
MLKWVYVTPTLQCHYDITFTAAGVAQPVHCLTTDWTIGDRSPLKAKDFFSSLCVHTGSGAHPASCTMGTVGPFPGVKRGRGETLTAHPHLVPGQQWVGAVSPLPISACMACRDGFTLLLLCPNYHILCYKPQFSCSAIIYSVVANHLGLRFKFAPLISAKACRKERITYGQ